MYAKALLIPIAAFALSASSVSAFNTDILEEAGLNQRQIQAFSSAYDLRKEGDLTAARNILKDAGIDLEAMEAVRAAIHKHKEAMRTAIDEAIEADDYAAFKKAIEGSPLSDIVTTEDDFKLFAEAHSLREEGDYRASKKILDDLGLDPELHGYVARTKI